MTRNANFTIDRSMIETKLKIINEKNSDIPILKTLVEEYWRDIEVKYRSGDEKKITLGNLKSTIEHGYAYYQPGYSVGEGDLTFLAYSGGVVAGFISLGIDNEKKELIIYDFMVRQEFQGKGFGIELMEFVLNKAKELRLDQIRLWVDDVNTAAKKLYQKFGFEFKNFELLDWNNAEGKVVLQTRSECWRMETVKTIKE